LHFIRCVQDKYNNTPGVDVLTVTPNLFLHYSNYGSAEVYLGHVAAQGTEITVSVDMGEGLIYFLVILFFGLNFCTPVVWFVYVRYLSAIVDRASKEVAKASKRFTERMSDTGRRTAQSIRAE
jgi:hypothetical protein